MLLVWFVSVCFAALSCSVNAVGQCYETKSRPVRVLVFYVLAHLSLRGSGVASVAPLGEDAHVDLVDWSARAPGSSERATAGARGKCTSPARTGQLEIAGWECSRVLVPVLAKLRRATSSGCKAMPHEGRPPDAVTCQPHGNLGDTTGRRDDREMQERFSTSHETNRGPPSETARAGCGCNAFPHGAAGTVPARESSRRTASGRVRWIGDAP